MGRLFIVEGADGTGKTTLFNNLVKQGVQPLPAIPRYNDHNDDILQMYVNLVKTTKYDYIMDRSIFSDIVYRYVLGGTVTFSRLERLLRMLSSCDTTIIHCVNENYFVKSTERGEDFVTDEVTAKKIFETYELLMFIIKNYSTIAVERYDYNDDISKTNLKNILGGNYGVR